MIRAGLVALLPVIALVIYIDGQNFDPEKLDFSKSAGGDLEQFFPESVKGLQRERTVRVFNKDNLFEYVNGHAEFFISSGFKAVAVAGYYEKEGDPNQPDFMVDIYDMGSTDNAFGVLSAESDGTEPLQVGFMGYQTKSNLLFIKGPYYVKITSFNPGNKNSIALANNVSDTMGDVDTAISQFRLFPSDGAIKSGRSFVRQDYMGLDFMTDVYEQEYKRTEGEFTAFLVSPKDKLAKLVAFYKDNGTEVMPVKIEGNEGYIINDEYEGALGVVQVGANVIGVRGIEESGKLRAFLKEAIEVNDDLEE